VSANRHGRWPERRTRGTGTSQRDGRAGDDLNEVLRSGLTVVTAPDNLCQVAGFYRAAGGLHHLGGDWFDALAQSDGAPVFIIGDVTGHDLTAAAKMVEMRSLLRGLAISGTHGPATVLSNLDDTVQGLWPSTYATCCVVRVDRPEDGDDARVQLRWSNAGHPPPVVVLPDHRVEMLESTTIDPLLGYAPGRPRHEEIRLVPTGSVLLLYTDGLVERRDDDIDHGFARLREALHASRDEDLELLCTRLAAALAPEVPQDDVAVLAVRLIAAKETKSRGA
jgi:serine phosphatase RsbU (regulator of sigma subunit)